MRRTLQVLAVVLLALAGCVADGLSLRTPDFANVGTTVSLAARSTEGAVRIRVTDPSGRVLLDSHEAAPEQTGENRVRVIWVVPADALGPFRVEATDQSGAKKVRHLRGQ